MCRAGGEAQQTDFGGFSQKNFGEKKGAQAFGIGILQFVNFFVVFCRKWEKRSRCHNTAFAQLVNKLCTPPPRFLHNSCPQRKMGKYLLITRSFPHSPQIFPQGLSTSGSGCGQILLVHINAFDSLRGFSYFFAAVAFYHREIFVQKNTLDKSGRSAAGQCVRRCVRHRYFPSPARYRSCGNVSTFHRHCEPVRTLA